jgi:hypothetical protein
VIVSNPEKDGCHEDDHRIDAFKLAADVKAALMAHQ